MGTQQGDGMDDLHTLENARYLTVAEVADALRVSKMTVYRLIQAGDLVAARFGKSYRVPEQGMNDYLNAALHGTTPPPDPAA